MDPATDCFASVSQSYRALGIYSSTTEEQGVPFLIQDILNEEKNKAEAASSIPEPGEQRLQQVQRQPCWRDPHGQWGQDVSIYYPSQSILHPL